MSMTISQLNDKARDAQNARDLLRKQDAAFKAIIQIMDCIGNFICDVYYLYIQSTLLT